MIGPFGKSPKVSHHARAVVTGAGSGIGAAFAIELARRGSRVVCSDIDEVAAKRTVSAIADIGGEAVAITCDVTQFDEVHRSGHAVAILVRRRAHAGDQQRRRRVRRRPDRRTPHGGLAVGAGHQPVGTHSWLPCLRADPARSRPFGCIPRGIINVASAAAFGAAPSMAAYNVSKAGALSLSETLAAELSGSGVKVTVLCPTFVKTNILESGRISSETNQFAHKIMRWTGVSADKVAQTCLDAHDRGDLYCMPQLEAKIGWNIKRLIPGTYTRAIGLVSRVAPL